MAQVNSVSIQLGGHVITLSVKGRSLLVKTGKRRVKTQRQRMEDATKRSQAQGTKSKSNLIDKLASRVKGRLTPRTIHMGMPTPSKNGDSGVNLNDLPA